MSCRKWVSRTRPTIASGAWTSCSPPTALDSLGGTVLAVVALLGMLAALVVLLRWWFQNRRR